MRSELTSLSVMLSIPTETGPCCPGGNCPARADAVPAARSAIILQRAFTFASLLLLSSVGNKKNCAEFLRPRPDRPGCQCRLENVPHFEKRQRCAQEQDKHRAERGHGLSVRMTERLAVVELGRLFLFIDSPHGLRNLHRGCIDAVTSLGAIVPLGKAGQIAAKMFLGLVDHVAFIGPL